MKLRTWCIRIGQFLTKTGSALKIALLLMLVCSFANDANAELDTQGITIRQQNVPLEKIFQSIEKQTGYRFFYNESLLEGAGKISLNLRNVSLQEALEACFQNQPFTYSIVERTIIVKRKGAVVSRTVAAAPLSKIIAVRGKVMSNNVPVIGATVTVKGTDNATSTDNEGVFTLADVDDQSTLVVSHVSHQLREIRLKGQTFIEIDLEGKVNDLDEAVVVAYNTTTQKRNTGSVTVVKGEQIAMLPNRSFDKSLQGLVPGLLVTGGTGQPGGGVSNFVLRGIATAVEPVGGGTMRNPLIVIDGIPVYQDPIQTIISTTSTPISNPLAQLNPSDIETISVLKDAAAVALYGARASNGVILITTKKGKNGKTNFSIRQQTDISSPVKARTDVLNQEEYLELLYETYKNANPTLWSDKAIFNDLKSKFRYGVVGADTVFYPAPNWYNEIFSNHAITTSNEFSVSGGNDKNIFYLNFEYTKQNAVAKKNGYDRSSIRFNFEHKPINWLKLGINSTFSYNVQNYSNPLEGASGIGLASIMSPLNPVRLDDGNYLFNYSWGSVQSSSQKVANPIAETEYNINRNTSYRGLSKIYAEFTFLKYLTFTTNFGTDFLLTESKELTDPKLVSGNVPVGSGRIYELDTRSANIITTNLLKFNKIFKDDHSVNAIIGQEAQVRNTKAAGIEVRSLTPPYNQLSNGTIYNAGGSSLKETLLSQFGQINYGYKNKYFLSGSLRRDGSSRFGERERFGTYWSTGIGWVVTGEQFMKTAESWLNFLKLRGSLGVAGNSASIDPNTRYELLSRRLFQNDLAIVPSNSPANPEIRWEKTFTWDAGIEAHFWNNRILLTSDVYLRKTSDLVFTVNLPQSSGYTSVLDNIGNMENKGIELSVAIDIIRNRNFRWNFNANWSSNKNKLVKANVPLAAISGNKLANEEGRNFNSFYLRQWAGVNSEDGKPLWVDSTGKLSSNYNAAKREFVGKPQPDGFGAITNTFTYKNIDLSVLIYYQYGNQIYIDPTLLNDGSIPYVNQNRKALNRWQKPGDIAENPRRVLSNTDRGTSESTRYLFNGDYIRLSNISISYTFPRIRRDHFKLDLLKIYVQANNLALWTNFTGPDPDIVDRQGTSSFAYPKQQSLSLGLNVTF